MKHLIAPSVLAADFGNLQRDIEMLNDSEADWLHVDIMDGNFVPNISFGPSITKTMFKYATLPLDVHMMVEKPERYLEAFRDAGADTITVHLEACPHAHRVVQMIKDTGAKAGISINPHTSVSLLEDLLSELDLILIMSVNPGFGGQKFIPQSLVKIKALKQRLLERNLQTLIEVDGGVDLKNAASLIGAGADVLVAGSSVFKSKDPIDTIKRLKAL